MPKRIERLLRDLDTLRQENERLNALERELAVAMDSLRESEERLRLAVEAAHMGIWEWDIPSNCVTWDEKKHDVFGLAHGSFAGTKEAFFELVHPGDRPGLQVAIAEALEEGAPYQNEFRIVTPAGTIRWIANIGQVYRDDQGRPVRMLGLVYDVTDRQATEAALRDSEEQFRAIVETTSEWIWALDRHGRITYSNPTVRAILGYRPEELVGQFLRPLVHEGDHGRVDEIFSKAIAEKGGWSAFLVRCRHKNGTYRYLECHGVPILDTTGEVAGFRGSDRDVTNRVEAEEALRDAHRMKGITRLAGGFAHHFNNLLAVIVGHVDLALQLSDVTAIHTDLQTIRQAAQRGALLTRHILSFAGQQFIAPKVVSLNALIEGMDATLRRLIGHRVGLVTQLSPGLWDVKADPAQLEVVIANLAINAQEAMRGGGTLTIATSNVAAHDTSAHEAAAMPGDYVMIAVTDTGTGMTEEVAQQIFEPFFSTKEIGPDSVGLGLSTCYGIVAQQGGQIRVQTQPGAGSTFRMYLPRILVSAGVTVDSGETSPAPPLEDVTVLIADDDVTVRKLVARILQARGYSVLEASSGHEALAMARGWHGRIDLLVTDIVMPGMSGWDLAQQLREKRPGLGTLYMSGYSENAMIPKTSGDKADFLHKPFKVGDLMRKVREIVDARK